MANQGGYTNTSQSSRRTSNDMSMDVLHHQKQQYQQQQQYTQSSSQQTYTQQPQPQQQYAQSSQQYTQSSYSQQQQSYPTSNSSHQQPSYQHPSPSQVSSQHSPTSYPPSTSRNMQINVNATTTPLPPPSYYHTTHATHYSSPSPPSSQHSIMSDLIHTLYNDLLYDVVTDICHRVHKQGKTKIGVPRMDVDIFGQNLKKMPEPTQKCDLCTRSVGVTKFAPHLEKCLGKGRGSRTVRQRKPVDYTNQLNGIDETAVAVAAAFVDEYKEDDADDDGEYTVGKKRKLDKNGSTSKNKKPTNGTTTNGHSRNNNEYWCDPLPESLPTHASVGGFPYALLREQMRPNENYGTVPTPQQISKMLEKICGVPSASTGKMCCNKFTCKTHNDHDRNIAKQQIESGYYVIRIKRIRTAPSNGSKPSRSKPSTTAPAPTYPPQVNYAYQ